MSSQSSSPFHWYYVLVPVLIGAFLVSIVSGCFWETWRMKIWRRTPKPLHLPPQSSRDLEEGSSPPYEPTTPVSYVAGRGSTYPEPTSPASVVTNPFRSRSVSITLIGHRSPRDRENRSEDSERPSAAILPSQRGDAQSPPAYRSNPSEERLPDYAAAQR